MRLNSKLTWGLAWAGLALVIAVPSLDAFSGNSAAPALITSDTEQVKVASATPATPATPAATSAPATTTPATPKPGSVTINPDGTVVRSSSAIATPPSTTASPPPAATETKTAEVEDAAPPLVAPIPAPASARPKSQPATTTTAAPAAAAAPKATESNQPLVIDEPAPDVETAFDDPNDLIPPASIPDDDPAALRAYLEERGLLEPYDGRSTASVQHVDPPAEAGSGDYDPDGFYLSDGPNSERRITRRSARSGWFYDEYGNLIFY